MTFESYSLWENQSTGLAPRMRTWDRAFRCKSCPYVSQPRSSSCLAESIQRSASDKVCVHRLGRKYIEWVYTSVKTDVPCPCSDSLQKHSVRSDRNAILVYGGWTMPDPCLNMAEVMSKQKNGLYTGLICTWVCYISITLCSNRIPERY